MLMLLPAAVSYAQTSISGTVTDENGSPVIGVAVQIEGKPGGVITDMDGKYTINAGKGDVLVFSSLGYETAEIVVSTSSVVNASLKVETLGLDEVVVVGYGTQSRRFVTSAITKVDGDVMKNNPVTSVGDALKGRVAGARVYTNNFSPGEDPVIHIRGGSSINNSNDPLILVDGVERSMAGLNPNDIASIEVLKDAASTAIYGSRASNGIVLITTKEGVVGQKPQITFEATWSYQDITTRYDLMNAEEYLSVVRPAMQFSPNRNLLWQDNYSASSANSATSVYSTRYLQPGETVPEGWKSMPDPLDPSKTLIFEDNDWQRQMYKPSLYQNYYVSLSGGTSRTRYMASLGYTDDNGVAIGTGYSRFAGRINLQSDITDKLKFRANVDYSDTNNDYMPNQMNQISRGLSQAPTMRLYFDDGTPAYGYNATSQSPLYYEWHTQRTSRYKRLSLVGGLSYQIFKDLKADLQMSLYNQDRRWGAFQKANYFSGSRPASENYSETTNKKIEFYLDYSKTIKDHTIAAMAGYSYYHVNQNGFGAAAEGASSDKIPTLTASPVKTDATSSLSEEVLIGYFARINYDYKKKYLLTATFRADGSSKFAPGHQWGYFPGVSVGWIMSEENFMKNVKPISYWKWRVSYGQTGNNAIGLWDARGQYATNKYNGNAGIYPSVMPNENLTWEVTDQLDAGIELALFDNRVMFTGDYFNKVTKNLLFSKNMPNTSGFSDVQTNIGKVRFWGFDIDITTRNIVRKNFTWETKFTWSYVRNKVLELPDNGRDRNRIGGITLADGTAFGGTAEGEPLYRYYGYKISHILQTPEEAANALYDNSSVGYDPLTGKSQKGQKFAGDYEWMNRPGSEKIVIDGEEREMISNQDQFLLGYTVPHSTGGLGNTIVFRNWTFNLYLDWALGHSILNDTEARYFINTFTSNTAISSKVKDCWTHVGDTDAKYAKFQTDGPLQSSNFRDSDVFNDRADYLCIREVSIAYNFPKRWVSKIGMQAASVVVSGNNLYYFTAVEGVSPEVGASSTYSSGYANYPPVMRLSLGLKVTF